MRTLHNLVLALAATALLGACSSRQLYSAGQQWQAHECRRLPAPEQPRCLQSNALSFDEYQRQSDAARPPR
jgi:hypothetical protein